jgi:hypothetical protein
MLYNGDQLALEESVETAVRRVGSWCEMAASLGASEWSEVSLLVSELDDCCGSVVVSCCCEKLVAEARGQFGNPEEGERSALEAVTRKLVKTQEAEKT